MDFFILYLILCIITYNCNGTTTKKAFIQFLAKIALIRGVSPLTFILQSFPPDKINSSHLNGISYNHEIFRKCSLL